MLHAPQQPHISTAVKHCRGWITLLAVFVAFCCVSQMLTYGFVKFTDVRFKEVSEPTPYGERNLKVVNPVEPERKGVSLAAETPTGGHEAAVGGVRAGAIEHGREVGPTRVPSNADTVMSRVNLFVTAAGSLACVMLAVMTMMGTVIAGGGNVPGVERTVTATTWSLVIGLLCLPWSSAFPSLHVPGVFADYHQLCAVADKARGAISPTGAFFQWIVMPIGAGCLSMMVLGLFRTGVERGIIATSVNHFDAAIQREMNEIAKRGVSPGGSVRAVGSMNRVVGMPPPAPSMTPMVAVPAAGSHGPGVSRSEFGPTPVESALEQAAAVASSLVRETNAAGRSVVDGNYRRLI